MVAQCPISFAGIPFPYNFESFQILPLYLNLGIHLPDPWQNFVLDLTFFLHVPTCFCLPNTSLIFSERHRDSFWGELLNNCCLIFADCSFPENRARACWRFPKAAPVKSCPHFPQICHRPGIRTGQKIKIGLRTKFVTNSLRESGQKFKTCACGKNKNCAKSEIGKISKIFDG